MGLYSVSQQIGYRYGIWHIEESPEELSSMLPEATCPYQATNRKLEFYAVRCLADKMGIRTADLEHRPSGEPYLKGENRFISISHTQGYAAIMLSDTLKNIGIDIERPSDRIFRVRHKFISAEEEMAIRQYADTKEKELKALYLHWCGKEALYKAVHHKDIDFINDFQIKGLTTLCEQGIFYADYRNSRYELSYCLREEYTLVCCHSV